MSTTNEIQTLTSRWIQAELTGDVAAMTDLTADGFTLVGPLGYLLDQQQWLDRYSTGDLVTKELSWDSTRLSEYGDTVVEVGVHTQRAAYQDRPMDGSFRSTHVLVRVGREWKLASIHLGPMPPTAAGK